MSTDTKEYIYVLTVRDNWDCPDEDVVECLDVTLHRDGHKAFNDLVSKTIREHMDDKYISVGLGLDFTEFTFEGKDQMKDALEELKKQPNYFFTAKFYTDDGPVEIYLNCREIEP